jgi:cytoskeletal protein CcmA (bactofilin family)
MVNGTVTTDKDVSIGTDAEITADIKADSATVAGTVKGKLQIAKALTLKSSAKISGDISTGTITIENGAQVNGQLSMGNSPSESSYSSDSEENPA